MNDLLFVYGTLRDPDVLAAVLGRPASSVLRLPAVAPGYATVHYTGRSYPALIRSPGASAEGQALRGLDGFERDLLDIFEGNEYRREPIAVIIDAELHEATAYLPTVAVAADSQPWTLAAWQAQHKPRVLAAEHKTAAEIRCRLLAVRPN